MTPDDIRRILKENRDIISNSHKIIGICNAAIQSLRGVCAHTLSKSAEWALCEVCEKDLGWKCDKSPDGVCHYFSINGFIEMINGEMVPVPDDYYAEDEGDYCIFCGDYEERK